MTRAICYNLMNKLKVALVGVYPSPFNGISIHIQRRLAGCLDNNIWHTVFDVSQCVKKAQTY
jgi:hypothetical protein